MGIELKTKSGNITLTAPKSSGGGSVDLSNYYTKAQTDEKLNNYALKMDVDTAVEGLASEAYVMEQIGAIEIPEVDLSEYAKLDDIPSLDEYAKAEDIPSLEGYAKTEDIPDVSGFQTEEQVIALIAEYGGGTLPVSEEGEF